MRLLAAVLVLLGFAVPFVLFGGRSWLSLVLFSSAMAAAAAAGAASVRGARFQRAVLLLGAVPVAGAALQLVPLPHGLVRALSPVRAELQAAVPVQDLATWREAPARTRSLSELLAAEPETPEETAAPAPGRHPLSFDPAGTAAAAVALAALLLLLSVLAGQPDERLGLGMLAGLLSLVSLGALYGLWHARVGGPLYGIFEPPPFDHHRPYGTFWNLNHFAGLAALACPVLLAAALDGARRAWLRIAALVLLVPPALAVLDAGSRGGLLAGAAGAVLLAAGLLRSGAHRRLGALLGLAALVGAGLASTVFSERLIDESFTETTALGQDSNRMRAELYRRQLGMIASAPLAGHGLGAFHDAHGPYKKSPESLVPHHGESDWLEVAVESGLPGLFAWMSLLAILWAPPLRLAWAGRAPPLLLGLLAGSGATVLHAAVDYHHREPPVAFASLILAGTAQAWARRIARGDEPAPAARALDRVLVLSCLAFALLLHLPLRRALAFDQGREGALRAFEAGESGLALARARAAAEARPADGTGWALVAAAHEKLSLGVRGEARREHRREALAASAEAVRRSPATLGAARRAGALLLSVGADRQALRAARLAVVAAPGHSPSRQLLGETLLVLGRTEEALPHLAFAYSGVPIARLAEQAPQFARLLHEAAAGDADRLLDAVRPAEHRAWLLSSLARAGRGAELAPYFRRLTSEPAPESARSFAGVLSLSPSPEAAAFAEHLLPKLQESWPRSLAARTMSRGGRPEAARAVLEELCGRADAPALAFLTLAELELAADRPDEAERRLRKGMRRHPSDESLRRRLEALEDAR